MDKAVQHAHTISVDPNVAIAKIEFPPWVGAAALGLGWALIPFVIAWAAKEGRAYRLAAQRLREENPKEAENSLKDEFWDLKGKVLEAVGRIDPDLIKRDYIAGLAYAIAGLGREPNIEALEDQQKLVEAIADPNGLEKVCLDCNNNNIPDSLEGDVPLINGMDINERVKAFSDVPVQDIQQSLIPAIAEYLEAEMVGYPEQTLFEKFAEMGG